MSNRTSARQKNDKDGDSQAPSGQGQDSGKVAQSRTSSSSVTSSSRDLFDDEAEAEADSGHAKRARNDDNLQHFSSPTSTTSSSRQFLDGGSPSGLSTSGKCIVYLICNPYNLIRIVF